jgi:oxalate decarboxylase/phosphoglucose isomerase-like protein (cupin superfamily)
LISSSYLLVEPLPEDTKVDSPQGTVPDPYTFSMSTMPATRYPGGSVKVVDSTIFKISKDTAAAEVTVEPGAMRELHVGGFFFGLYLVLIDLVPVAPYAG